MIILVPLKYEARVHKKRHREPSNETFYEWLEVDVPEFDDMEAPVAVQWLDETPQEIVNMQDREKWGGAPSDKICQTRWFNNDHWWPALRKQESKDNYKSFQAERISSEELKGKCLSAEDSDNPLVLGNTRHQLMSADTEFKGKPLIASDYKEVISSNREEVLDKLNEKINDVIIVNDQVWVRGKQPVVYQKYTFLPENKRGSFVGLLKIVPEDHESVRNSNSVYSINQFDEARAKAFERAEEGQVDPNARMNLTVFISESIKNDTEKKNLLAAATLAEAEFGKHFGEYDFRRWSNLSPDTGIAFFEFKRTLLAIDGSDEGYEALADAIQKFEPLCAEACEHSGRRLRHALGRWNTRPIELNVQF